METSTQLIALRTAGGASASSCLPSAVFIASYNFPSSMPPKTRNAASAATGAGQAVGSGPGLVSGGACVGTIGWR